MLSRWPALLGGLEDRLDRGLAARQVGCEAALVADADGEPAAVQDTAERVVDLGADLERLGEAGGARRHDHELLQVDRVGGVNAAVDDVHHRHRKQVRPGPAEVAVERQAGLGGGRVGGRERDAEDRVRAQPALVRRCRRRREQRGVERSLVGGVEPEHRRRERRR